ncbi:uncharacterized protein LOC106154486 [Lingula anatina]|uniref:Uncharacterized protein LOC106154486 n=1 Tax=Lingula anatina TaxID=7574 RepID=A0A1S3HE14_LINAN|nr:uncharacterized protein LOC106154486 [Lingula anatina]|eukprot:XP_013384293.1 uncharacterized protein LOC106154486 [Lingula anatina]
MGKVIFLFAVLAVAFAPSYSREVVPSGLYPAYVSNGVQILVLQIEADQVAYNVSLERFKVVNASCNKVVETKTQLCVDCVKEKCEARAQDVCSPTGFNKFLYDSKVFFESGLPNFFTSSLPNFVVGDAKRPFVYLGTETDKFFTNGGFQTGLHATGDFFKNIGSGLANIKNIDFGNLMSNIGSSLGNLFGKLDFGLGKRRRRDLYEILTNAHRVRRSGQPTCNALQSNASAACSYYIPECPDCDIVKTRDCDGYEVALKDVLQALSDLRWLSLYKENKYEIYEISYGQAVPYGTPIPIASVKANLFGNVVIYDVENMNMFDLSGTGIAIAEGAIAALKAEAAKNTA